VKIEVDLCRHGGETDMSKRTVELLILFLIALYVLNRFVPSLFAPIGQFVHILIVAVLILILVRLLQWKAAI
jgi:hypothetical protein